MSTQRRKTLGIFQCQDSCNAKNPVPHASCCSLTLCCPLSDTDILSVLPRFFSSLNAKPSPINEPSPARDCQGPDSCHNTESPSHYRVRFSLEGLVDFQGMHGAATQGDDQGLRPSVNFRKRPNYDNSKRILMKIQRPRQQCPT